MSEDGQQRRLEQDGTADGWAGEENTDSGPAERIITDADAAREVAPDVSEDDPELEYKLSVYRYEEQPEEAFAPLDFSRIGEDNSAPRRGRSIGDYITLLLLIIIPVGIGLLLLAVSQNKQQEAQPVSVLPTPQPAYYADQIAIVGLDTKAAPSGGGAEVDITVNNKGTQQVQVVNLQVRVFDEAGKQVGSSGIVAITDLAPGALGRGSTTIRTDRPIDQTKTEAIISSVLVPNAPTRSIEPSPTVIGGNR